MDLRRFYHEILKDDALADMSVSYINDDYFMSKIAEKLKSDERNLIQRLAKIRPLSGYYEIETNLNKYFYLIKNRIILPSGSGSGFVHVDVVRKLTRLIRIYDAENRYSGEEEGSAPGHQALKLRITLADAHTPVWREVMVPADFNFYELYIVIQKAMGWQGSHLSSFFGKNCRIFVHEFEMEDAYSPESGPELLLASNTRIEPVLSESGTLTYIYDYGDDWMHGIEVLEKRDTDKRVIPEVVSHKGPGPIEDSGGVGGFEGIYSIIKDEAHPEHEEMLLWAKSQNYKARYPKKAINRSFEKIFSGGEPVTELNDPSMDE